MSNKGIAVRVFEFNDNIYQHKIFSSDDDRVELQDDNGICLMTYTASCKVLDQTGKCIGRIGHTTDKNGLEVLAYFEGDYYSKSEPIIYGTSVKLMEPYLDIEVDISKYYLAKKVIAVTS